MRIAFAYSKGSRKLMTATGTQPKDRMSVAGAAPPAPNDDKRPPGDLWHGLLSSVTSSRSAEMGIRKLTKKAGGPIRAELDGMPRRNRPKTLPTAATRERAIKNAAEVRGVLWC